MNPFLPAAEQQNVREHLASFVKTVRQTLADIDVDAENRLEVEDMLATLESTADSAITEMESAVADAEAKAAALKATLQEASPPLPASPTPDLPTPEPAAPKETADPAESYRLGNELLNHFGHLTCHPAAETQALRTIHDWLEESLAVAARSSTTLSRETHQTASPNPLPPSQANSSPSVPNHAVEATTASQAPAKGGAEHLDMRWTAWLRNSRIVSRSEKKQANEPEAHEEIWRDIFKGD